MTNTNRELIVIVLDDVAVTDVEIKQLRALKLGKLSPDSFPAAVATAAIVTNAVEGADVRVKLKRSTITSRAIVNIASSARNQYQNSLSIIDIKASLDSCFEPEPKATVDTAASCREEDVLPSESCFNSSLVEDILARLDSEVDVIDNEKTLILTPFGNTQHLFNNIEDEDEEEENGEELFVEPVFKLVVMDNS